MDNLRHAMEPATGAVKTHHWYLFFAGIVAGFILLALVFSVVLQFLFWLVTRITLFALAALVIWLVYKGIKAWQTHPG